MAQSKYDVIIKALETVQCKQCKGTGGVYHPNMYNDQEQRPTQCPFCNGGGFDLPGPFVKNKPYYDAEVVKISNMTINELCTYLEQNYAYHPIIDYLVRANLINGDTER